MVIVFQDEEKLHDDPPAHLGTAARRGLAEEAYAHLCEGEDELEVEDEDESEEPDA